MKPPRRRFTRCTLLLTLLALCSCRATGPRPGGPPRGHAPLSPPSLPPEMLAAGPGAGCALPLDEPLPLPQSIITPWHPPGIAGPWPRDEYLHDGGEQRPVVVNAQGHVVGLEPEDTIVHFDTLDGRTLVEPSNRVCIYSPRFAAVRQVEAVVQADQRDKATGIDLPVAVGQSDERLLVTTAVQPVQLHGDTGIKQPTLARLKQAEAAFSDRLLPAGFEGRFKAYENFQIVRLGEFEEAEKARLEESVQAAIAWTQDKAVQVILDRAKAVVETGDQRAQATFRADIPTNPSLRVVKVASTCQAKPGEFVEFTIRFDNTGDAAIGNVTLMDNLTTRLEYVPGTAKSSRDGEFFTSANEGDSLLLIWEFAEPLEPGHGGLVRFQCRVR